MNLIKALQQCKQHSLRETMILHVCQGSNDLQQIAASNGSDLKQKSFSFPKLAGLLVEAFTWNLAAPLAGACLTSQKLAGGRLKGCFQPLKGETCGLLYSLKSVYMSVFVD
jgi:hypothetical protein